MKTKKTLVRERLHGIGLGDEQRADRLAAIAARLIERTGVGRRAFRGKGAGSPAAHDARASALARRAERARVPR
jgi:hypothetical protein